MVAERHLWDSSPHGETPSAKQADALAARPKCQCGDGHGRVRNRGCKRQRGSACQPKTHEGLNYSGVDNQGQLVKLSVTSSHPWCRSCHTSDTCGIRTHAGRSHRLSRPTPWPLGQSGNVAMNTGESQIGLQAAEGFEPTGGTPSAYCRLVPGCEHRVHCGGSASAHAARCAHVFAARRSVQRQGPGRPDSCGI